MNVKKGDLCICPNCGEALDLVENHAVLGQPVPHINDCPECGEPFEVRDNADGSFNVA
jgi:predicted RNA-binding Zn-ribbon protein involved in translation (DUF1610 family)